MLSYVLPTRNRPDRLQRTLDALGELDGDAHRAAGGGEVIVVDNASQPAVARTPSTLANGLPLRIIRLNANRGAAARNVGVENARGSWIVMLDDDSHPLDCGHIDVLLHTPPDVAAIGADIVLPDGSRERGGLPEVIIGCGAAIRREAFLAVDGYDATFDYYAEEYDLCAKLILAGWRVAHEVGDAARFRVLHEKTLAGRDFNAIVLRLVRNNARVMQRYAPESVRQREIAHTIERYAAIALREQAARGFAAGMAELLPTLVSQPRTPMPEDLWDRFTGASAARRSLGAGIAAGARLALVDEGKNVEVIRRVLAELNATIVHDESAADAVVIGTLSPGPMRDAWKRRGGRARMCA